MEKRALIAIVLSVVILILYQEWVGRFYGPSKAPSPGQGEPAPTVPAPPEPVADKKAPVPPAPQAVPQPTPPEPLPSEVNVKEIQVETDHYVAVFTNLGARLKSLSLKQYRSSAARNSAPFEMILQKTGVPYPLGIELAGPAPFNDEKTVYEVQGGNLNLTGDARGKLVFRGRLPGGGILTKEFTLTGSEYPIGMEISIRGGAGEWNPRLQLTTARNTLTDKKDAVFEGLMALVGGKLVDVTAGKLSDGEHREGDIAWAGFGYTYFLFAALPEGQGEQTLTVHHAGPGWVLSLGSPAAAPGPVTSRYTLFAGPKDLDILKAMGKGLDRSINFGWSRFVSAPLLHVLRFSHHYTGSYGIDIILLTILIKLLLAPLTHKSFVSMKQMQKLQPQMQRIKERYQDDKEKMNKEIMELYRRNKVNPLGGCLPMVLQFPVFIGLYNALRTPIDLRHASFLWIHDLSRPDYESLPFTLGDWKLGVPVLVLLMGVSMFVQQWMTPSAGDPNQKRMMLMMPVVFTAMFVTFPAGLTIYWLVNNILTIAQQYFINRMTK